MDGIDLGSPPEIRHLSVYLGIFTLSQIVFELTTLDIIAQTLDKVQGCVAQLMLLDDLACPSAHTASNIDDIVAFFLKHFRS